MHIPSFTCNDKFLCLIFLVVPEVTIEGAPEEVAVVGNEIQLTCHYNSSPVASEVQWLKNGKVISRNNKMENNTRGTITRFNGSSIQLTISPSVSSDAANYTCLVIKDVGNSSDTIAIRGLYQVPTFQFLVS